MMPMHAVMMHVERVAFRWQTYHKGSVEVIANNPLRMQHHAHLQ
jgi:hypothetical protein